MSEDESTLRRRIVELCLEMNESGLNQGTSGNIGARFGDRLLITPSGIPYRDLEPAHIASMPLAGGAFEWDGPCKPSSEWHFHRAILRAKPDVDAVVHTHATFATVLSMAREPIPACHYMIAAFGGATVECAGYATFGTPELSTEILQALRERTACLLANHGMLATGATLDGAMWTAVELETLAKQYWHARQGGDPVILSDEEIERVLLKFRDYGPAAAPG